MYKHVDYLQLILNPYEQHFKLHQLCLVSQLFILHGKNFQHWILCANISNQISSPLLANTIDFCHFILHSVTLTKAGGHKGSATKCCLHFHTHFSSDQDEILYGVEAVQVKHPNTTFEQVIDLRETSYWFKGNNCYCLNKLWWHAFRHLWTDLDQT